MLLGSLVILALGAWWLGSALSPGAAKMAVGMVMGMVVIAPSMMLLQRRNRRNDEEGW